MELWLVLGILALLSYLVYREVDEIPLLLTERGRLCDFFADGVVYEDVSVALQRGVRLIELHVYADEQDHPVVATKPSGHDFAEENVSFNSCCVALANDAFPSKDPMIVSLMMHTSKNIVMDRMAETLQTTVRKHLVADKDIVTKPVDSFANKLILVSGGDVHGSKLDSLINLSWSNSNVRRLTFQQAVFSRDEDELIAYNKNNITLVASEPEFKGVFANSEKPKALGCQWRFGILSRA